MSSYNELLSMEDLSLASTILLQENHIFNLIPSNRDISSLVYFYSKLRKKVEMTQDMKDIYTLLHCMFNLTLEDLQSIPPKLEGNPFRIINTARDRYDGVERDSLVNKIMRHYLENNLGMTIDLVSLLDKYSPPIETVNLILRDLINTSIRFDISEDILMTYYDISLEYIRNNFTNYILRVELDRHICRRSYPKLPTPDILLKYLDDGGMLSRSIYNMKIPTRHLDQLFDSIDVQWAYIIDSILSCIDGNETGRLELAYRTAYNLILHKNGDETYERMKKFALENRDSPNRDLLRKVTRNIFEYMNRIYCSKDKKLSINELFDL